MNEFELNLRLKQEMESLAPNRLEDLLTACEHRAAEQSNMVPVPSRRAGRFSRLIAAAAAMFVIASGAFFGANSAQRSVVSLDVNPSVSITVNGFHRVKRVAVNNADAQALLNDKHLNGMSLEKAVETLAGDLIQAEYLTPNSNGVLVTVKDAGDRQAERLAREVVHALNRVSESAAFQPAVFVQQVGSSDSGRDVLEQVVASRSAGISSEDADSLSIHELLYVLDSQDITLQDSDFHGTLQNWICRSDRDAEQIAAEYSGAVLSPDEYVTVLSVFQDELAYQVSFLHNGQWQQYWVSAASGQILNPPSAWTPSSGEDILLASPAVPDAPSEPQPTPLPNTPVPEQDPEYTGPKSIHDFFNFIDDLF